MASIFKSTTGLTSTCARADGFWAATPVEAYSMVFQERAGVAISRRAHCATVDALRTHSSLSDQVSSIVEVSLANSVSLHRRNFGLDLVAEAQHYSPGGRSGDSGYGVVRLEIKLSVREQHFDRGISQRSRSRHAVRTGIYGPEGSADGSWSVNIGAMESGANLAHDPTWTWNPTAVCRLFQVAFGPDCCEERLVEMLNATFYRSQCTFRRGSSVPIEAI